MTLGKKIVCTAVAVAAAWAFTSAPSFAAERSLYERLGGQGAIQAVVTKFIGNVGADKRINNWFATTDLKKLNKLLVCGIIPPNTNRTGFLPREVEGPAL